MLRNRGSRVTQILLTLLVLGGTIAPHAQDVQMVPDQADREAADKAQRHKSEEEEPVTTLKARSELVQLFFNVKDKKGGLIPSLTKDEFEIYDNKQPQTIKYFTANSNLPLTLGIMIDTSLSQQNVLGMEQQVGGAFLGQILTDKDQAFVIDFGVRVSLVQDFTSSVRRLKDALNSVRIDSGGQGAVSGVPGMGGGPVPTVGTPKGTLLFDAVYLASHDQMGQQVDRKALILLTDGEDQGSQYRIKDAIESAQKADTIVYVLLCADRGFYWNAGASFGGDSEMKKLTSETGGRVIEVGNKPEKLKAAFQQISDELRSQYNAGYVPLNPKRDGSFHKVEVRSKQGYKVQSRSGYFAIPD
ncbi:MAG TPA: VWA domain-containing protein [Terriglobales bacterium]|jgi:VWFA-related protein|nr:VWA domain-containing protein [Terriglobales bacterium]